MSRLVGGDELDIWRSLAQWVEHPCLGGHDRRGAGTLCLG